MGYNLRFGNFKAEIEPEDRSVYLTVEGIDPLPEDAPYSSVGDGGRGNGISPSYSVWDHFASRYGIWDVFFGQHGVGPYWTDDDGNDHDAILARHPGAAAIEPIHLKRFTEALEKAPMSYDDAAAAMEKDMEYIKTANLEESFNYNCNVDVYDTLRLNWLVYWTKWVLENCEFPTFANS